MTSDLTLSQSIVRAVCERDERPDPDHDDTLLIAAEDLEAIIDNHFEAWCITCFRTDLPDFQSRTEAAQIADAVLDWLVKHELADADNEYRSADVIAIMNDLAPSPSPKVTCFSPTHRHKKRGSIYQVIARGRLQVDGDLDMERVTIYCAEDGTTWVRPDYEFNNGRFEALTATATEDGR